MITIDQVTVVGQLKAVNVCDNLDWGQGVIAPLSKYNDVDSQVQLVEKALACIQPVQESNYSACTDGRLPLRLLDGVTNVPVRQQLAGADILSAFFAAEVLGVDVYVDANASTLNRLQQVASLLTQNGIMPSSHLGCGAATNFSAVVANVVKFANFEPFVTRVKTLLPFKTFNDDDFNAVVASMEKRCLANEYASLSADDILTVARSAGGDHAIGELLNDERGVRGHLEEAIIRIKASDLGLNSQKLAAVADGRQVFVICDSRLERLADILSRGDANCYQRALMALEVFTDAVHATLVCGLPTYEVSNL